MATALGKFLRRLRIDNDELLKNMADKLGVASSTLSSIENGRRNPPKGFIDKVREVYQLGIDQFADLEAAVLASRDEVKLRVKEMPDQDRELAVAFARRFENLSDADKKRIKEILNDTTAD